jgi:hypothetical protein
MRKTMNTKTSLTAKILLAASTVLSLGVLSGCQHCEPLLLITLAMMVLRRMYGSSEAFYEAMQVKPCSGQ